METMKGSFSLELSTGHIRYYFLLKRKKNINKLMLEKGGQLDTLNQLSTHWTHPHKFYFSILFVSFFSNVLMLYSWKNCCMNT